MIATNEIAAKAPTLKEIDALILEYASAQKISMSAQTVSQVANSATAKLKVRLTLMVESYGVRHTEKSKRLAGLHNTATTTTGTRATIDDSAVDTFKTYLGTAKMPELVDRFFSTHMSYCLVAAPLEILKTLTLGARIRTKMTALLALCNKMAINKPALSIEVIEPEKPEVTL